MAKNKSTKTVQLVGEICLYGNSQTCGAGWLARGEKTGPLGTGEPRADRSFTEAVWMAAGALQAAGVPAGVVVIYAPGGDRYALASLGFVPAFGDLRWHAAGPGIVISAEQIQAAAS